MQFTIFTINKTEQVLSLLMYSLTLMIQVNSCHREYMDIKFLEIFILLSENTNIIVMSDIWKLQMR